MKTDKIRFFLDIIEKVQDWTIEWDSYDQDPELNKPKTAIELAKELEDLMNEYFK